MKIVSARITPLPLEFFDPLPVVYVTTQDGVEHELFSYFPDEITFFSAEFIGLTLDEARTLKFQKDRAYLLN
jgi:hypothetical protein